MTVLEDDVISKRNKLSLGKQYFSNGSNSKDTLGRSVKRRINDNFEVPPKKTAFGDYFDMNGYRSEHRSTADLQQCPVATLSNMGNTCFLNSVLYALRFAPTFLHNLHHLIEDLGIINARINQTKLKSSSLGRNVSGISGPSSRSTSSKDLLSLGINDILPKSKVQIVSEKLHELFMTLHNLEIRDSRDAYQPVAFLQSVREANYIFEGNHQQDAHELLVYLLDNIRETCDLLAQQVELHPELLNDNCESNSSTNHSKIWNVRRSWKKTTKKKEKNSTKETINEEKSDGNCVTDSEDAASTDYSPENGKKKLGYNFVAEDFEGVTLIRTKCLECECVTERREPFYDIPVPILSREQDSNIPANDLYKMACVTKEKLCDSNKYLCENCMRYNEASREVSYEKLPNMMVLQLKRFTTSTVGVQKVVSYHPTPLKLACFCDTCCTTSNKLPSHHYDLSCVIMHLGGTMASGHYIAYVKASDRCDDYIDCTRDIPKGSLSASSSEKSLNLLKFLKPRGLDSKIGLKSSMNGIRLCKSSECCGVRINRNVMENLFNSYPKKNGQDVQDDIWLECDDENIRAISSQEFQEVLSSKPNSTSTPYLLFYTKISTATLDD